MLMLALDSATQVAGVALSRDGVIIKEIFSNYKKNHSEVLLPLIDQLLGECGLTIRDLSAVATTIGPGSFTGLRIGLATAKGLCFSAGLPLIAVPTLDVLAHNIIASTAIVGTVLDARKNEVYMCLYDVSGTVPKALLPMEAGPPEYFVQRVGEQLTCGGESSIVLLGDGTITYSDIWTEAFGDNWIEAPHHLLLPRAAALASLAYHQYLAGDFQDLDLLRPYYIRPSEAELRLDQTQKGEQRR